MQLLNRTTNQNKQSCWQRLQTALQDMVSNIEIKSNFCISHPKYKPWELPAESVERFSKVSEELQKKYTSLQLRSFLYGTYYNGSMEAILTPDEEENGVAPQVNLENDTFLGVNLEFYDRLHQSNQGKGYYSYNWQVLREERDGTLAVNKDGLTLHIQRDRHLKDSEKAAKPGERVALLMPRNLVQNGFYMAVSDAGPNIHDQTVRVYFNVDPEGAVGIMASLTKELNSLEIPFTFKVLYNPKDYERHDSGVLYFDRTNYEKIHPILASIYQENQQHFRSEIPLFTKSIATGLAVAEEPDLKFVSQESFGQNRCQIVANGLLEARKQGDESKENRMAAIEQQFSILGINIQKPYLNANSQDIYTPLDVCK